VISRVFEHEGQGGETDDGEVLHSMHDQPSDDVLYVVKHIMHVLKLKLYVSHRLYDRKETSRVAKKNQHRIQSVLAHQEETIKHVPYDI